MEKDTPTRPRRQSVEDSPMAAISGVVLGAGTDPGEGSVLTLLLHMVDWVRLTRATTLARP